MVEHVEYVKKVGTYFAYASAGSVDTTLTIDTTVDLWYIHCQLAWFLWGV